MNFKIGIIGGGRMGRERARSVTQLGAKVMTVCDADSERAQTLAAELHAQSVTHPGEIDWQQLDAAFICTPPGCRGAAELAAIEAGVPLLVEKPIGLSAEPSMALLQALEKRPVINAVGYMNRYRQSVLQARDLVAASPALGVVFHWLATQYRVPWWLNREQSGGPVNEQCTHFVDLCRFLIGEISAVSAVARPLSNAPQVSGTFAMTLTFDKGTLGVGLYGCESNLKQIAFEIFRPDGSVRLQGWDLRLGDPVVEDVFVKETGAFFRAIQHQNQSLILSDFKSAFTTQCVIDAVRRAAESGRRENVTSRREASVAA
jgi:myo-inositol 2-dehydrogenase/D-chiro-inositol 1-dehydrogenase